MVVEYGNNDLLFLICKQHRISMWWCKIKCRSISNNRASCFEKRGLLVVYSRDKKSIFLCKNRTHKNAWLSLACPESRVNYTIPYKCKLQTLAPNIFSPKMILHGLCCCYHFPAQQEDITCLLLLKLDARKISHNPCIIFGSLYLPWLFQKNSTALQIVSIAKQLVWGFGGSQGNHATKNDY